MAVFVNLTINGVATGLLMFMMASGLTLIFGLMGVMNFAHGTLFMFGAYMATRTYALTGNFALGLLAGTLVGGGIGLLIERTIIRRAYGNPMGQALITLGAMMILNEMVKVIWGPDIIYSSMPVRLVGAWTFGAIMISRYRVFIIFFALGVAVVSQQILNRTRLGMIVRAGVEKPEMVQALGINLEQIFSLVFVFGAMLAALGGALIGPFQGQVGPVLSVQYMMLAFIVVVIGGLGSLTGTMLAGIIVGLANNYVAWLVPEAAMAVNVLLMAVILLIKPSGLFSAGREG